MANIQTSIFGGYAEQMQAIIDRRLDQFKVPVFSRFLTWDAPQVDLTFADVIGRSRIEALRLWSLLHSIFQPFQHLQSIKAQRLPFVELLIFLIATENKSTNTF